MSSTSKSNSKLKWFTRNRIIALAVAVVVIAGGASGYALWRKNQTSTVTAESVVQTATVTRGDLKLFATGTGTLIANADATFGFSTSGTVVEVLTEVGDVVSAGDLLARLDDSDAQRQLLQAQRAVSELTSDGAVATAKLAVADAAVAVVTTKATLAYLISTDVLFWEEQVKAAEIALAQAKADAAANPSAEADKKVKAAEQMLQVDKNYLAQAWHDYQYDYCPDTFLTTVTEGRETKKMVIPPSTQDVAQARADYALAQQTHQEAEWYLTAITTGEIPEGATGASLEAYQQALEDLDAAQAALDDTNLYAPIGGTVMSLGFQTGDTGGSGTTVSISDLSQPYQLEVYLDESDWGNIKAGYPVEVTFDLLPEKIYTGTVVSVDPGLSTSLGSAYIHAYVKLDTAIDMTLPLGTGASVDVIGGQADNALLIPVEALHEIAEGKYAVFVLEDGEPKMRLVEIGLQDLISVEIKSGLNEGDLVTTGITETN
jgi:HlyD family secretion protein